MVIKSATYARGRIILILWKIQFCRYFLAVNMWNFCGYWEKSVTILFICRTCGIMWRGISGGSVSGWFIPARSPQHFTHTPSYPMTENQTNQPSQPADPNSDQHVPESTRKARRGHFASDGIPQRSATPASATPAKNRFEQEGGRIGQTVGAGAETHKTSPPKHTQHSAPTQPVRLPIDSAFERTRLLLLAAIMIPLCIWASLPAWESMVYEWYYTDDYSHGFIVVPATLFFLYLRLETYPGTRYKLDWVGLSPILIYGVLRIWAGMQSIDFLDQTAIFFWILSVVWFFYGWRAFLWALPSLCFLVFLFQLPWRADMLMRNYLQMFAAQSAAVILQLIGEPAIPIKNTIRLSTMELGVEAACSGLRFLMSFFAIAYATILLMRRPWWQNILIMAVAAPLALFVNALRIAITGILLLHCYDIIASWTAEGHSVGVVADAFAGKVTIFLALGLFALFVWYLGKVFRRVEI